MPFNIMSYTFQQQSSVWNVSAGLQIAGWAIFILIVVVIAGVLLKRFLDRKYQRDIFLRNRNVSNIVRGLHGLQFEVWVKELFLSMGVNARVTGGQGDHGIDVVAEYQGKKIGIQCKKFDKWLVGEPALRDLYGVKFADHYDKVILITTGNFSNSALSWAKGKKDLILVNEKLLERIILNRKILKDML